MPDRGGAERRLNPGGGRGVETVTNHHRREFSRIGQIKNGFNDGLDTVSQRTFDLLDHRFSFGKIKKLNEAMTSSSFF